MGGEETDKKSFNSIAGQNGNGALLEELKDKLPEKNENPGNLLADVSDVADVFFNDEVLENYKKRYKDAERIFNRERELFEDALEKRLTEKGIDINNATEEVWDVLRNQDSLKGAFREEVEKWYQENKGTINLPIEYSEKKTGSETTEVDDGAIQTENQKDSKPETGSEKPEAVSESPDFKKQEAEQNQEQESKKDWPSYTKFKKTYSVHEDRFIDREGKERKGIITPMFIEKGTGGREMRIIGYNSKSGMVTVEIFNFYDKKGDDVVFNNPPKKTIKKIEFKEFEEMVKKFELDKDDDLQDRWEDLNREAIEMEMAKQTGKVKTNSTKSKDEQKKYKEDKDEEEPILLTDEVSPEDLEKDGSEESKITINYDNSSEKVEEAERSNRKKASDSPKNRDNSEAGAEESFNKKINIENTDPVSNDNEKPKEEKDEVGKTVEKRNQAKEEMEAAFNNLIETQKAEAREWCEFSSFEKVRKKLGILNKKTEDEIDDEYEVVKQALQKSKEDFSRSYEKYILSEIEKINIEKGERETEHGGSRLFLENTVDGERSVFEDFNKRLKELNRIRVETIQAYSEKKQEGKTRKSKEIFKNFCFSAFKKYSQLSSSKKALIGALLIGVVAGTTGGVAAGAISGGVRFGKSIGISSVYAPGVNAGLHWLFGKMSSGDKEKTEESLFEDFHKGKEGTLLQKIEEFNKREKKRGLARIAASGLAVGTASFATMYLSGGIGGGTSEEGVDHISKKVKINRPESGAAAVINQENIEASEKFSLKKGDNVWAKLENHYDGDQAETATTINEFRKETGKELIEKHGLSQEKAKDFIRWRFRHMDVGESFELNEKGKLKIDNFIDQNKLQQYKNSN